MNQGSLPSLGIIKHKNNTTLIVAKISLKTITEKKAGEVKKN